MILDVLCRRLAEMAASSEPMAPREVVELEKMLSDLEMAVADSPWTRAGWLALDLGEIHRRICSFAEGLDPDPLRESAEALCHRLGEVHAMLRAHSDSRFASERVRVREGELRGAKLLEWLAGRPPVDRDMAVEHLLGIAHRPLPRHKLGADLVDYIPSGIAPIVRATVEVPIVAEDVFVDVGAGLGKVAMMVHLLSGARTRGIELQPELVAVALARAAELALDGVSFERADARNADFSEATVVFLYLPFTGETLFRVLQRLEAAARQRSLVVCTLGLDLSSCSCKWLRARETEEVWLSIYDTYWPGMAPRSVRQPISFGPVGEIVASERPAEGASPVGSGRGRQPGSIA